MEASSIVSRARTAFHSAAAKAERVFTDIKKSDLTTDRGEDSDKQSPKTTKPESPNNDGESKGYHEVKHLRWRPTPVNTKQDWQERLKNIRIGKKGVKDIEKAENSTMAFAIFDENLYLMSRRDDSESKGSEMGSSAEGSNTTNTDIIPPVSVMKQLAIAVEAGKKFKSMKDLLAASRDSSPVRERAGLSFSAMKSLVLREREEKFTSEFGADEKVLSLINSLLDAEGHFTGRKIGSGSETHTNMISLPKDIHGAPLESFIVKLSEVIGSFKTLKQMALFWFKVVAELKRLWSEGQYIPGIPPDAIPDLNSCLLYQQLQVINCCVSRKRRRSIATDSLDSVIRQANSNVEESAVSEGTLPASPILYARTCTGELVLRLGADKQSDNLTMLETGEPVYTPVMQEGPLLTEDVIKETEEFVLRTGSVGAGCSQLLSDMQAFKAANPGCILEDFVRWHSPPDWMETETSSEAEDTSDGGDLLSTKGQLSTRMQKEGNLWRELWETAKPVPAIKQTPLFDEDLAVEGILNILEDIPPSELFEQLFISLLGSGFVFAEATLPTDGSLSKLFYECKDYIVATCQGSIWTEKVDDICQVYETVETILLNPDEVLKIIKQPEETTTAGESKYRFKRLRLIFSGKDRHSGKPTAKDPKNSEDNSARPSFSSIFSKKPPKPGSASPGDKAVYSFENDWTVVKHI
uniref:Rab3GAP catalytic subunit conserved domain-containing protein n=1 Tax=Davidia involucrata TaxID=16924 RepID=A0A5B7AQQ7_DAVIN